MLDKTTLSMEESLIREIQNITGSKSEDFTNDTIIGSDINQIRHLFYYLLSKRVPVFIKYQHADFKGWVTSVDGNYASLSVEGFKEGSTLRCRIKFEILSVLYQFEVAVYKMKPEQIIIRIPNFIQSAQRRKYKRIAAKDLFMKFNTLYQMPYGRSAVGQLIDSNYPEIIAELKKEYPNLALINRIITEKVIHISPDYDIRYYKPDEPLSLKESIITTEKRTLFLKDSSKLESYYEPVRAYGLINYEREYRKMTHKLSEEDAKKFFEVMQKEDMHQYIMNYVCSPIQVFDRVIGHIYLYSTLLDMRPISQEQAFHVDLMARLLSYALSKTSIAETYFKHDLTKIVNISLGGLLFELDSKTIFDFITYHDRLNMNFRIKNTILQMRGRITRFFPIGKKFNVGVRFDESSPDDLKVLENAIYESTIEKIRRDPV